MAGSQQLGERREEAVGRKEDKRREDKVCGQIEVRVKWRAVCWLR
jgi:hypothetical protein